MVDYLEECLREPVPREWSFPEAEYRGRLERVRGAMDRAGLDVLLVHSVVDNCYLCGYQSLWPEAYVCLVVPRHGEPFMQVGEIEGALAVLQGYVTDIVTFSWVGSDVAPAQLAGLLAERGFGKSRIGVQMGSIEMGLRGPLDARAYLKLTELLPEACFADATRLMFDLRVVKSPAEIEHLRRAGAITATGMRAAIEAAEPGSSENRLSALAAREMMEAGSEFFSIDPITSAGHRSGWFHTTFKRKTLRRGDHVLLEFGGCWHRYTAPMMRTVILGAPGKDAERVMEANRRTLDMLYAHIRAGRTAHEVAVDVKKGMEAVDDEIFRSGHFGYSIGLGFPPTWTDGPMYIAEGNHRVLEAGMTFHTPHSFRIPARFVIGASESIAVTESGCEILTPGVERQPAIKRE